MLPPPPTWLRIVLTVLGVLFVAIGLVGLALPVVPQLLPLVLGAIALTLVHDGVHRRLERWLHRWPRARSGVQRGRRIVHDRLVLWFPAHYAKQVPAEGGEDPSARPQPLEADSHSPTSGG